MPCRSDYMEPSQRELNRGNAIVTGLNELADELTHINDVFREFILGEVKSDRKVVMPLVNKYESFYQRLNTLEQQHENLYYLARSSKVPGLIEHVWELMEEYDGLNKFITKVQTLRVTDYEVIRERQIAHREADLSRLMRVFGANGDRKRLKLVLDADATKPLEPQLGFNADDF